jgi:hypothetical protein
MACAGQSDTGAAICARSRRRLTGCTTGQSRRGIAILARETKLEKPAIAAADLQNIYVFRRVAASRQARGAGSDHPEQCQALIELGSSSRMGLRRKIRRFELPAAASAAVASGDTRAIVREAALISGIFMSDVRLTSPIGGGADYLL